MLILLHATALEKMVLAQKYQFLSQIVFIFPVDGTQGANNVLLEVENIPMVTARDRLRNIIFLKDFRFECEQCLAQAFEEQQSAGLCFMQLSGCLTATGGLQGAAGLCSGTAGQTSVVQKLSWLPLHHYVALLGEQSGLRRRGKRILAS